MDDRDRSDDTGDIMNGRDLISIISDIMDTRDHRRSHPAPGKSAAVDSSSRGCQVPGSHHGPFLLLLLLPTHGSSSPAHAWLPLAHPGAWGRRDVRLLRRRREIPWKRRRGEAAKRGCQGWAACTA